MNESEVIFEECSPNGNLWAIVESDEETCYFYLHADASLKMSVRSCWLRNLKPAPQMLDVSRMREGKPPMLPAPFCKHPMGSQNPDSAALSVIWSEEGDAAALCENGDIIAILERNGVTDEVDGFSRDCVGFGPLCHELHTGSNSPSKWSHAKDYWESWSKEEGPWPDYQKFGMDVLDATFGAHSNYYGIDGGNWPPKAMLRFNQKHVTLLITLGMGLRAQPGVELFYKEVQTKRRIELALCLDVQVASQSVDLFARYLSGQSSFPWSFATFLGAGHTLPSDVLNEVTNGRFTCFILDPNPPEVPALRFPDFRGEPVNVLWMRAISEKERDFAEQQGSQELFQLLNQLPTSAIHSLARNEVL